MICRLKMGDEGHFNNFRKNIDNCSEMASGWRGWFDPPFVSTLFLRNSSAQACQFMMQPNQVSSCGAQNKVPTDQLYPIVPPFLVGKCSIGHTIHNKSVKFMVTGSIYILIFHALPKLISKILHLELYSWYLKHIPTISQEYLWLNPPCFTHSTRPAPAAAAAAALPTRPHSSPSRRPTRDATRPRPRRRRPRPE